MSFLDVEDPVVPEMSLSQNSEVVVAGEMSTLDVELVEHVAGGDEVGPHLLDVGVVELMVPVMVVLADLGTEETPVSMHVCVYINQGVAHCFMIRYVY